MPPLNNPLANLAPAQLREDPGAGQFPSRFGGLDLTPLAILSPESVRPDINLVSSPSTVQPRVERRPQSFFKRALGTLGDALLAQSGQAPIYAPAVRRQQTSDALLGFTEDPEGAIERLSQIDPEAAAQLYGAHQNQLLRQQQLAQEADQFTRRLGATQAQASAEADVARAQQIEKARALRAEHASNLAAGIRSEEDYRAFRPVLDQILQQSSLGVRAPEEYDPRFVAALAALGVPAKTAVEQAAADARNAATVGATLAGQRNQSEIAAANREAQLQRQREEQRFKELFQKLYGKEVGRAKVPEAVRRQLGLPDNQ